MNWQRTFVRAGDVRLHLRSTGAGACCVYFHQSPLSSRSAQGLATVLPPGWYLLAPDTPGYGLSPPLSGDEEAVTIERLAAAMGSVLGAAGVRSAVLLGTHTGALLAVEVARQFPTLARAVVLDGLPVFTPEERDEVLASYFASYAPQWDGSHLARLWARAREQAFFFPWYARDAAHRMAYEAQPAAALQGWVLEMLYAGEGYAAGYAAAFRYEALRALAEVQVPVRLLYRETDPLAHHRQRLPHAWQARARQTDATSAAMWQAMAAELVDGEPVAPTTPAAIARAGEPRAEYLTTGMVWVRRWPRPGAKRALVLHDVGRSGDGCVEFAAALASRYEVVLPDLPGHGESDESSAIGLRELAATLHGGDARSVVLVVQGGHAASAMELARAWPGTVERIVLIDPPPSGQARARWQASWPDAPEVAPHGGHLLAHWQRLRDRHLFWPGSTLGRDEVLPTCAGLEPQSLQLELFDALRCRPGIGERWRAALQADWRELAPPAPVEHAITPTAVWWDERTDVRLEAPAMTAAGATALLQFLESPQRT